MKTRISLPSLALVILLLATALPAADQPLDPSISELLRQAAVESEVAVDAGFEPPVVPVGEPAIYRVVVMADPAAVVVPEIVPAPPEIKLEKGGVGASLVNQGQTSRSLATYNFRVTPRGEGSFTIPGFTVTVSGQPLTVPERTLTVVASGTPVPRHAGRLLIEAPPGDVYLGQMIPLQLVALDPGDHSLFGLVEPKAAGDEFIFERVPGSQRRELRQFSDRSVSVVEETVIATPIHEGRLTVTASAFIDRRASADESGIQLLGYRPFLEAEPLEITVKHLPGGALPGFTSLIGKLDSATARPLVREARAGEPFDLPITVVGEGNLDRLVPPAIPASPAWRVVPPTGSAKLTRKGNQVEFHYTLIPQTPGLTATPVIPFSYFDPEENGYRDLSIALVQVLVLPPVGGLAGTKGTNTAGITTAALPAGLGVLAKQPVHFHTALKPWHLRPEFWLEQLLIGAALGTWYGWCRRRNFLAAHPELVKLSRARRALRRLDRHRRQALRESDAAGFLQAMVTSLRVVGAAHVPAHPDALVADDVVSVLPVSDRAGRAGELVRQCFDFADRLAFRATLPDAGLVWRLQPEWEALLAELRRGL